MIVYLSHSYTGDEEKNYKRSIYWQYCLVEAGHTVINPLTLTVPLDNFLQERNPPINIAPVIWVAHDLNLISRCDAVFVAPFSDQSKGVFAEEAFAIAKGIHIYYNIEDVPKNGTEIDINTYII